MSTPQYTKLSLASLCVLAYFVDSQAPFVMRKDLQWDLGLDQKWVHSTLATHRIAGYVEKLACGKYRITDLGREAVLYARQELSVVKKGKAA